MSPTWLSWGIILMVLLGGPTFDSIALLALANIPANETIFLSDRGWEGTALRTASSVESTLTWTTSSITAGDIIRISTSSATGATFINTSFGTLSGSVSFDNVSGAQLLIYQGSDSTPTFIYAFNADRPSATNAGVDDDNPLDGWTDAGTTGTNSLTQLPPGLTKNAKPQVTRERRWLQANC